MATQSDQSQRRALQASLVGSTLEFYDYIIFGLAAALVFPQIFFPHSSPVAGTLSAFATFAVGFVARPIGAAIAGHFGDRIGRRKVLLVTLLAMGAATGGIGLLPTFEQVGIWAPTLLVVCRIVQGLSLGGEWSGSVLLAVEQEGGVSGRDSSEASHRRAIRLACCSPTAHSGLPKRSPTTSSSYRGAGAYRSSAAS
ncbi:major facilitator transporter [Rhodococcus wratislaviensis]|uniref:Major facilitator transporter n=1 Tax=Rhodococcus wratislaviensis TaxID=44752 RepID=A0AB38F6N4_RHOWR|nr:MFS transporter [Rhodococcus wratislaviensis]SPZ35317.1 major facilitator transporter [Rhodococcus wratislaviensis]